MRLKLTFPDNCRAERKWIADVLLRHFLGISAEVVFAATSKVVISAGDRKLELPDLFFQTAAAQWLGEFDYPPPILPSWNVAASGLHAELVERDVPVLFGKGSFTLDESGNGALGLDIFGAAFFMLSRYEEAVSLERDGHGRFPASASVAFRCGFLHRPLADEYVEILWAAMNKIWPVLKRKPRQFRMVVSCDVDHPYHPGVGSLARTAKRVVGELVRTNDLSRAATALKNYRALRTGNWDHDPYYYTVDWMMDVNERAGNRVSFYFIPEITDSRHDDTCPLTDKAVLAMMARISARGHEIGLHPGYNTYESRARIASAKRRLQSILDRAQLGQKVIGGRHHYLRWSTRTPAIWDAAGLEYDSTLSYAEHAGFRCGTCHEYPMYDLHRRVPLKVRQRPLVCMEASVLRYMGYGVGEQALAKMMKLKAAAVRMRGNFTLLWHNSAFDSAAARDMYCQIIRN
jgi:peptidoglycan/xylan/chitin deacetylase (PgdA/CDA1 family)